MRELTDAEVADVGGGILPLIGFGLALAGKVMGSTGVAGWAIGSASLIMGAYSLGDYWGE